MIPSNSHLYLAILSSSMNLTSPYAFAVGVKFIGGKGG